MSNTNFTTDFNEPVEECHAEDCICYRCQLLSSDQTLGFRGYRPLTDWWQCDATVKLFEAISFEETYDSRPYSN